MRFIEVDIQTTLLHARQAGSDIMCHLHGQNYVEQKFPVNGYVDCSSLLSVSRPLLSAPAFISVSLGCLSRPRVFPDSILGLMTGGQRLSSIVAI